MQANELKWATAKKSIDVSEHRHLGCELVTGDDETRSAALDELKADFDYIDMSDTIGYFDDIQSVFNRLHAYCTPETRLIIAYYSHLWESVFVGGGVVSKRDAATGCELSVFDGYHKHAAPHGFRSRPNGVAAAYTDEPFSD